MQKSSTNPLYTKTWWLLHNSTLTTFQCDFCTNDTNFYTLKSTYKQSKQSFNFYTRELTLFILPSSTHIIKLCIILHSAYYYFYESFFNVPRKHTSSSSSNNALFIEITNVKKKVAICAGTFLSFICRHCTKIN